MAIGKDGRRLLTRREAAGTLAVTYDRMRHLEREKLITGRQIRGVWYFEASDVERLAPNVRRCRSESREGELAAEAFKLFRDKASDADVVIALRMTPARVRELRRDYDPGVVVLSGAQAADARKALEQTGRTFERGEDLVAELAELCLREQRLTALELEQHQRDARRARARGERDTLPAPPASP